MSNVGVPSVMTRVARARRGHFFLHCFGGVGADRGSVTPHLGHHAPAYRR